MTARDWLIGFGILAFVLGSLVALAAQSTVVTNPRITGDTQGGLITTRYDIPFSTFTAAAVTQDVTLTTLPFGNLQGVFARLTTTFACASVCTTSTLSATVGRAAGGTTFLVSFDMDAATGVFGDADAEIGTDLNRANAVSGGFVTQTNGLTPVTLRLTSGTGNLGTGSVTNLSQGALIVWVTMRPYQ
jgi:hypothetical protein